jgi:hypothetical protein
MKTPVFVLIVACMLCACGSTPGPQSSEPALPWWEGDGRIERTQPPADSAIGSPRTDSYEDVIVTAKLIVPGGGRSSSAVPTLTPVDRPRLTGEEPLDLDVTVRVDGPAGLQVTTWRMFRMYQPLYQSASVRDAAATRIEWRVYDWNRPTLTASTSTSVEEKRASEFTTGVCTLEVYLQERAMKPDGSWFQVYRVRYRFKSEHPDWRAYDTVLTLKLEDDRALEIDIFKR